MAESFDDEFVPEIPPDGDKMVFAEELVEYIMVQNFPNYCITKRKYRERVYNAFDSITQKAVCFLDKTMEMNHYILFQKMKRANSVNCYTYAKFANDLAARYFSEGFDAKYFLIYCVNLSRLAVYFFSHGILDACRLAKLYIYNVLGKYDMSSNKWGIVHRIAEKYEKMQRMSENELKLQNKESHRNESQIRAQNEVSDEESIKYSLCEGQNALSEDKENDIYKVQDLACSSNETSLKESVQYSLKSKSEMGLSPFKESESLRDNTSSKNNIKGKKRINRTVPNYKLRPGTASTDKEYILIKIDCKIKMDLVWNEVKGVNDQMKALRKHVEQYI